MPITERAIEYGVDGAVFEGVLVEDAARAGQRGVVMFPNALGVTRAATDTAIEFAARGYTVFVADLYGKDVRPPTLQDGTKVAGPLRADPALWRRRLNASLDALAKASTVDPKKLCGMGFCFGGSCVLELARSGADVRAVASLHGGVKTANVEDAKNIKGSVFVLHGAEDPFVPAADLRVFEDEMRAASVDWQLIEFGGAFHSFADKGANVPGKAMYDAKVVRRAFRMVDDFFTELCG